MVSSTFTVDVGIQQGSAQNIFLFIMVMDVLIKGESEKNNDFPGSMMFAELCVTVSSG